MVLKQSKSQTSEQEAKKQGPAKEIEATWSFTTAVAIGTCHKQQSGLVALVLSMAGVNSARMRIAAISGTDWAAFAGSDGQPRPFGFA